MKMQAHHSHNNSSSEKSGLTKSKADLNEKSNTSIFDFSNTQNKNPVTEADSGTFTALLMKPNRKGKEEQEGDGPGFDQEDSRDMFEIQQQRAKQSLYAKQRNQSIKKKNLFDQPAATSSSNIS